MGRKRRPSWTTTRRYIIFCTDVLALIPGTATESADSAPKQQARTGATGSNDLLELDFAAGPTVGSATAPSPLSHQNAFPPNSSFTKATAPSADFTDPFGLAGAANGSLTGGSASLTSSIANPFGAIHSLPPVGNPSLVHHSGGANTGAGAGMTGI